jgi:polysaccharide biosynthesis protein PslG
VRVLALIAAVLVVGSSADTAAAAKSPGGFFGVSNTQSPTDGDLATMGKARVAVLRMPFAWADIETTPGTYQLAEFDRIVARAASAGIRVLPFIYGTPVWARNCAGFPAFYCDRVTPLRTPQGRAGWPQFLRVLVNRYGPNGTLWSDPLDLLFPPYLPIRTWQIWNEQNSGKYFRPRPTPKAYFKLLKPAADTIRSGDKNARILLGGLFATPPKPSISMWRFLDRLYRVKGAKKRFDGVAIHPYSPNIKGIRFQLRRAREVMRDHGDKKAPLFLTELGWGSGEGSSDLYKGISGQASMLSAAFKFALKNRRRYGLAGVTWFSWRDLPPSVAGNCVICASFGLLNTDSTPKPSYNAFAGFTGGQ